METHTHYQRLEAMYRSGAIHRHFPEFDMELAEGKCVITTTVNPEYHHAAGAAHGLYFFKLLDDTSYFAAATVETEYFLLTRSFSIELLKPITSGELRCEGDLTHRQGRKYQAEAKLYFENDLVARAQGLFLRGSMALSSISSFA